MVPAASRLTPLATAAFIGVSLGVLAWTVTTMAPDPLVGLEEQRASLRQGLSKDPPAAAVAVRPEPLFRHANSGLEVPIRLEGISNRAGRRAALLSIGGAPAKWLTVGMTEGRVTLTEVRSDRVVVESAEGPRTILLGDLSSPRASVPQTQTPQPRPGPEGP